MITVISELSCQGAIESKLTRTHAFNYNFAPTANPVVKA